MKTTDFPGIQQGADDASQRSQSTYVSIVKYNLICGVMGALITIYNFEQVEPKVAIYFVSLVLLIATLVLTVLVKHFRYEDIWYQSRALAESIKTLTWRYITCSDNFEANLSDYVIQRKFNDDLTAVSALFPDLLPFIKIEYLNKPSITAEMTSFRTKPWNDRLSIYIKCRIEDQIDWYTEKAGFNQRKRKKWLTTIVIFQALSIVACLWLIFFPASAWNLVGLLTTISASIIGWLQLKQHQALFQAYITASLELTQIKSIGNSITDEGTFIEFVLDSENAISREHTTWLAQRRK